MIRRVLGVSVGWLGISMLADGIPAVLLPHQLLGAGRGDATTLGLTTLVAIGLAAAVQPLAGRWSDAIGRWPVIAAGVAIAAGGLGLLLVPAAALIGAVLALVGVSVAQAGHQPLLPDRVPGRWRGRAAGVKGAFDVGGALIAFLLLAALLGGGAAVVAAVVLAAALGLSFLLAYALLGDGAQPGVGDPDPASTRLLGAYRLDIAAHRPLLVLVAARFLFLIGIYAVGRFLVLFVADRFGLGADEAAQQGAMVLAALALVTVLASVPSGWLADRLGRPILMLGGGLVGAAGIGLLPFVGSLELVLMLGVLLALGSAAFSAGSWAALSDVVDRGEAGRLLGLANVGTAGAAAAAGAFGPLIDLGNRLAVADGYAIAFGTAAICAVAGGMLGWQVRAPATDATSPAAVEVPH